MTDKEKVLYHWEVEIRDKLKELIESGKLTQRDTIILGPGLFFINASHLTKTPAISWGSDACVYCQNFTCKKCPIRIHTGHTCFNKGPYLPFDEAMCNRDWKKALKYADEMIKLLKELPDEVSEQE